MQVHRVSRQYVIRKLLIMIPSLLGISVVLFSLLALAPGDPFDELATNPAVPPEVRAALRAKFGLDDPVWMRYWHWLIALLQGDWGFSFVSRMDVSTLIMQRLPVTLIVIGASQILGRPGAIAKGGPAAASIGNIVVAPKAKGRKQEAQYGPGAASIGYYVTTLKVKGHK